VFDPSVLRHSEIGGVAYEVVLNKVHEQKVSVLITYGTCRFLNDVGIFIYQAVNGFLYEMFHKWKQTGTTHYLAEYFFLFLLILLHRLILQSMYIVHTCYRSGCSLFSILSRRQAP
jgi:hypothetical protein